MTQFWTTAAELQEIFSSIGIICCLFPRTPQDYTNTHSISATQSGELGSHSLTGYFYKGCFEKCAHIAG